jgi:hypothetical protein
VVGSFEVQSFDVGLFEVESGDHVGIYIYQPCYIYIQYINVQYQRGMRHTSTALYVYRAAKKNAHEPTANFRINLSKRKYVLTNCLQLFYLRLLSPDTLKFM